MHRIALLALVLSAAAVRLVAADHILTVLSPEKTVTLTAGDLRLLPHREITATDPHENKPHRFSGVLVRDLLLQVGAPLGEKLRGRALQLAVLVHSKDGYATLFALADSDDGAALPANAAPLRLIVPGDKRAARWARMVTSIEIVRPGAGP
ncbi:MAG TPA: hypothetical protein VII43_09840 [Opitutaceae bacterium]